jgi:hypothetical protein
MEKGEREASRRTSKLEREDERRHYHQFNWYPPWLHSWVLYYDPYPTRPQAIQITRPKAHQLVYMSHETQVQVSLLSDEVSSVTLPPSEFEASSQIEASGKRWRRTS